ncbi:MAG TPA: FAD-binding protein, partial [Dehalococcoidia bacterium]|nr:FAD-binding protein [Dehalococcoidia bacterium]
GRILQRAFGGHTYRRLAHVGDRTGLEMIRTLQDRGVHQGLDVFMECTVARLFLDDGRIAGCLAYWRETGRFVVFKAKAIVMATGGIGKMFQITSNSWEYTGDGMAMAYEVGAELLDMEFTQFHPTGMVWPPGVRGILVTEAVRGEGGVLTNALGERFMERYDPKRMELSTRDIVAKAINEEVGAGRGSPHGGVFLDISHRGHDYIIRKLPSMYHQFKDLADVDITREPMEVGPTMHYMMGGIRVDPETQASTVPGLYACGECAGGMHGGNRLGGNSLSDLLVFGQRAGAAAAEYAKGTSQGSMDPDQLDATARELVAPFERERGETPYDLQAALQETMQTGVGIVRDAAGLSRAIDGIAGIAQRMGGMWIEGTRLYNPGWHLSWDMRQMLIIAEAVARAALQREESRGGHTRLDFPESDHGYWESVNSIVRKKSDGSMETTTMPKPEMPEELRALLAD